MSAVKERTKPAPAGKPKPAESAKPAKAESAKTKGVPGLPLPFFDGAPKKAAPTVESAKPVPKITVSPASVAMAEHLQKIVKETAPAREQAKSTAGSAKPKGLAASTDQLASALLTSKPAEPIHIAAKAVPVESAKPKPLSGGEVLRDNFERANALASNIPLREEAVTLPIYLRMVRWKGGYLIGLLDGRKATYAECEFFAEGHEKDALAAWQEWLIAVKA